MNIMHEFRPPSLYASREEAIRVAEKALERSNDRITELIVRIDELEHKFYWNIGNTPRVLKPKSPIIHEKTKPVIQENEMTIVQKAVVAVLLLWSISVTVHLCFQDKSFTDGFFWKYCFTGIVTFLLVQLVFLAANRRAKMMAVERERDAAITKLKYIHTLTMGEESTSYRSQGILNSPIIREIASLTK